MKALSIIIALFLSHASADVYDSFTVDILPPYCYETLYADVDVEEFAFRNYTPISRPVQNASKPISVSFGIIINRIVDLFEKERTILVEAYLIIEWRNELINWESVVPNNCSKKLIVPSERLWIPDISVVNAPTDKYSLLLIRGHKVEISYSGTCIFYPSGVFNATCSMNLRYFPFDEQTCRLRFAAWSYPSEMQRMFASSWPIDFDGFVQHEQWDLYQWEAEDLKTINPTNQKSYDEVDIVLHLRRKPNYYLINVFIPVIIITVVVTTIFSLPMMHGVKLETSFKALLSFGVFQTVMLTDMPRDSGASLPLFTLYLDLTMAYIGLVLLGESIIFLVLRRGDPDNLPAPRLLMLIFTRLAVIFRIEHQIEFILIPRSFRHALYKNATKVADIAVETTAPQHSSELVTIAPSLARFENEAQATDKDDSGKFNMRYGKQLYQRSWMLVAQVLERMLFVIYIFALIITPVVIYTILPTQNLEK